MNLSMYKNKINNLCNIYNEIRKKYNKLFIISLAPFLISGIAVFFVNPGSIEFIICIVSIFIFLIHIVCVKISEYYIGSKFVKTSIMYFIFDIINEEYEYDIQVRPKKDYVDVIKAARFSYKYDYVSIIYGFDFNIKNVSGTYTYSRITRSYGKTAVYIINGDVLVFKINNDQNLQIRNDRYSMNMGKKDKNLSTNDFNVYYPKSESNYSDVSSTINKFNMLKKLNYNNIKYGIDFQNDQTSVFFNWPSYNFIKVPKVLDYESFNNIMEKFIKTINRIEDIIDILTFENNY